MVVSYKTKNITFASLTISIFLQTNQKLMNQKFDAKGILVRHFPIARNKKKAVTEQNVSFPLASLVFSLYITCYANFYNTLSTPHFTKVKLAFEN